MGTVCLKLSEGKVSCSMTQHSDSTGGESRTRKHFIPSLMLYQLLCPWSRHFIRYLVLDLPKKIRLDMTEKLIRMKKISQNKTKTESQPSENGQRDFAASSMYLLLFPLGLRVLCFVPFSVC